MALSPSLGPQLSPDGGSIAFVRDDEIYVIRTTGGEAIQITSGAKGADKKEPSRRQGFWWSLDSRFVAFAEVDTTAVGDAKEDHGFPLTEANVKLRLGIVPAAGGDATWVQLHTGLAEVDDAEYLTRVTWLPDSHLTVQVQKRAKIPLKTLMFDRSTGTLQEVVTQESGSIQDCFTPLRNGTGKPQPDCDLLLPTENGEPATFDDKEVQFRAADMVQQSPALFDGLCCPCLQLLRQRLSGISPLVSGVLSTSPSEVMKNVLPSSGCSGDGTTTPDSILRNNSLETIGQQEKVRLWSEEIDDESPIPIVDRQDCGSQFSSTRSAAAPPAKIGVAAGEESQGGSDMEVPLSLGQKLQLASAKSFLTSPKPAGQEEMASSSPGSPFSVPGKEGSKPRVVETVLNGQEMLVSKSPNEGKRKKNLFSCMERVYGNMINVTEGLELHKNVFTSEEQEKLVNFVYASQQKYQQRARDGLQRDRTYSQPRKWMPGKGRVTIQFGCCYNYAVDNKGNPPGILHDDLVDPLPPVLKNTIRRLIKWHVLPESCVPDSCIINIYDVGDCIPPHIDHHDFYRPFCTLSLLSECSILFGSKLKIVGDGLFDGPLSIPLPVGSVLVLNGNGADVAKHAVPGVPTKRISITFRKMDPARVPRGYELPIDLRNIKALPQLSQ